MYIMQRYRGCFILIGAYLLGQPLITLANNQFFPLPPRLTSQLTVSDMGIFNADAMLPMYGNAKHIIYLNGLGNYGTNASWMGSVGIGLRNISGDWLFGTYLFTDWNKTQYDNYFWVMNPGLEWMHRAWDFHMNGYFPTQKQEFIQYETASHLGNTSFLYFNQHAEFDKLMALYDVIGNGGDLEVGYSMPFRKNRLRFFAGSYFYYPPKMSSITGLEEGMEFPMSQHVKVILQDSYDNVFHNTAALSIQFTLGGVPQSETDSLEQRLLEPIPRHLGTIGKGDGVLDQGRIVNTGQSTLVDDNLWFFQPGSTNIDDPVTEASCTFEHPCVGLEQTTIDEINVFSPNAKLYLAPGQYDNSQVGDGFTLYNGQSIFGRTDNYLNLAEDNERALINDTLFLNGNNLVTNLQVNGQSDTDSTRNGIVIKDTAMGNIQINNSNIEVMTTDANHSAVGIRNFSFDANVLLQNSTVTATTTAADSNAIGVLNKGNMQVVSSILLGNSTATTGNNLGIGIFNEDLGVLTISNSDITGSSIAANSGAMGVYNEDLASINISNSTITANAITLANGIFNEDLGSINITDSTITANAITLARGIANEDLGSIHITDSTITANANDLAESIFNEDLGVFHIDHSILNANSEASTIGIYNEDIGRIYFSNSTINASSPSSAIGIFNQDVGMIYVTHSTIAVNGGGITLPIDNHFPAFVHLSGTNECLVNGVIANCF